MIRLIEERIYMSSMFATQNLLIKLDGLYHEVIISIGNPAEKEDGFFYCFVDFSNVEALNARIRGADGINCLESALVYIKGVCSCSDDPQFYFDENEPYIGL